LFQKFNISTLGEYADLYLKTDVLLLADVFENFRTTCMAAYGLDPAHYYTAPGLAWDAMLKHTKKELTLITDHDMYNFIELGVRGGVSQCSQRYEEANNPYATGYDKAAPTTYLQYYDVNNLSGWAMQQHLPYDGFKWIDPDTMPKDFWRVDDDSPVGYILEVDLAHPRNLHDTHKDLPFCPENRAPPGMHIFCLLIYFYNERWVSNIFSLVTGSKQPKLLTTLYHKYRYKIHYRNLKQAVEHGLRITKIHRALEFSQEPWLKPYIDLNTSMRQEARNEFEKNLFKLMNNAVFGKTMEDVKRRRDIKLLTKWEGRYVSLYSKFRLMT